MFDIFQIASWIKKRVKDYDILNILFLIFAYFATRLTFLDRFPIFSDEGIYIHWAKVARADATWRFISLTDGKQPLQTWGTIPFLKLFPDNGLLAGRLFAVSTGFVALTGIFLLLYYLWGKKAAFAGSFLYILTPYFLFYDRIALVDSGVNAGFIWTFFFSILLIRTLRLDVALLYGLIGGVSLLAKSSSQLFMGLSALAPITVFTKDKKLFRKIVNYFILYSIGLGIAVILYNVQRLSPFLHFVTEKNKTFVLTPQEFLQRPFDYFFSNVFNVPLYVWWESGFILPLLGLIGLFLLLRKDTRLAAYIFLWIFIPYMLISFFSKILFPRYIIFLPTLFLILASYIFTRFDKNKLILIAIIFFASVIYFDYTIIADYKNIPFPPVDRGQYLEGWPAGWGAKEIVEFAREKTKEKPVIILAEGSFGMTGDVLDSLLQRTDIITIKGYWPLDRKELIESQKDLGKYYIYVVYAHPELFQKGFPNDLPIRLIKKYDKPNNKSAMYLYELVR